MSTALSSILVLAFCLAALIPVAIAYWRPGAGWPVAALYVVSFLALIGLNSDFSRSTAGVEAVAAAGEPLAASPEQCGEALAVAEEAGIIVDRRSGSRIVVNAGIWPQLPQQVRDALVACLEGAQPDNSGGAPIEIVEQAY